MPSFTVLHINKVARECISVAPGMQMKTPLDAGMNIFLYGARM